jgi:Rod binding domain-containing protein
MMTEAVTPTLQGIKSVRDWDLSELDYATRLQRTERLEGAAMTEERAREVAKDFEAMFAQEMLKPIFAGLDETHLFGSGQAGKMWKSMLIEEYADILAEQGAFGVGDMIYDNAISAYLQTSDPSGVDRLK